MEVIGGGIIKFSFFPPVEADLAIGTVEYPSGTSIETTRDGYLKLEEAAKKLESDLSKEFPGEPIIKNRLSTIGFQPQRTKTSRGPGKLRRIIWRTTLGRGGIGANTGRK